MSTARSSLATSITKKPTNCSLASANGPSVITPLAVLDARDVGIDRIGQRLRENALA